MRDILLYLILPLGLVTAYQHWRGAEVDEQERVYYTWSGGVYCSRRELTPCGYKLTQCSDTMVYLCITNLKYEDKP